MTAIAIIKHHERKMQSREKKFKPMGVITSQTCSRQERVAAASLVPDTRGSVTELITVYLRRSEDRIIFGVRSKLRRTALKTYNLHRSRFFWGAIAWK